MKEIIFDRIIFGRSALLTLSFRTAKDLCPNLQKPPLPSKIPGYAPENTYGITSVLLNQSISIWMVLVPSETHETHQHIMTSPLFSFFQEPSTIIKITEENFEVKSTNATATISQPIGTKPSNATLKHKDPSPNKQIPKLSIKLSPPPLTSLKLTPPTPQQLPQQKHLPSFTFPTIFLRTIGELLDIIPQRPKEMIIRTTF